MRKIWPGKNRIDGSEICWIFKRLSLIFPVSPNPDRQLRGLNGIILIMLSLFIEPFVFLLGAGIILGLKYFNLTIGLYQQLIALFLAISILIFSYLPPFLAKKQINPLVKIIVNQSFIFISSVLVQLAVMTTGGLLSPLLILFHIYAIGLSFIVNLRSSLSFIAFGVMVLIINDWFGQSQLSALRDDTGSVLLYLASFIVIIPISWYIAGRYKIKDELAKVLSKQVNIEDSIIKSINDLIIVTDVNLKILTINEETINILDQPQEEIVNKPFFDVVFLKDQGDVLANIKTLSIDRILIDRSTRTIPGFKLFTKKKIIPFKVVIKISPILNTGGEISELSFIFSSEKQLNSTSNHQELEAALLNQQKRFSDLKATLAEKGLLDLSLEASLLGRAEGDLLIFEELESQTVEYKAELPDLAVLSTQIVKSNLSLAKSLGVELKLIVNQANKSGTFLVPFEKKWLTILIDKLIDLSILASSGSEPSSVGLTLSETDNNLVEINIRSILPQIISSDKELFFKKNYGVWGEKTNLKLGSGLEGCIAREIAIQLNIPFLTKIDESAKSLNFIIHLSRNAH